MLVTYKVVQINFNNLLLVNMKRSDCAHNVLFVISDVEENRY